MGKPDMYLIASTPRLDDEERHRFRVVVAGHATTTAEATAELLLALGLAQPEEIKPDYLPGATTTKGDQ